MTTVSRNMRAPSAARSIERFVAPDIPTPALVKAVYTRQREDGWRPLMVRFFIGTTGERGEPEEVIYPNVAFVTRSFPRFRISSFFEEISADGFRISETFPLLQDPGGKANWTEDLVPSHATGGHYPSRRFSAELGQTGHFQDEQLVGAGKPYHKSAISCISEFLDLDQIHGRPVLRNGEVSLQVADERGAIRLTTETLSLIGADDSLNIVGQINEETSVFLGSHKTTWTMDENEVGEIELWLVNRDDEIIDYRSSTEWPYIFTRLDRSVDSKENLREIIQKGESETTEFKPFISLDDPKKAADFEKAVCALSNLRGGRVFVGVNDAGEIVGTETGAKRKYGTESRDAVTLYAKDIEKRLQETLRDTQCFRSEIMELVGSMVVVITVTASSDTNYLHRSNEAYVRTGATSRRMSPPEVKEHRQRKNIDLHG